MSGSAEINTEKRAGPKRNLDGRVGSTLPAAFSFDGVRGEALTRLTSNGEREP